MVWFHSPALGARAIGILKITAAWNRLYRWERKGRFLVEYRARATGWDFGVTFLEK